MTDGPQGRAADLANSLGYVIGHREKLVAVFIEQKMVITEVRTAHVPVEVLGFDVQAKMSASKTLIAIRDLPD